MATMSVSEPKYVFALVDDRKTPPAQVAGDDHHECKLWSSEVKVSHVVLPAAAEYRVLQSGCREQLSTHDSPLPLWPYFRSNKASQKFRVESRVQWRSRQPFCKPCSTTLHSTSADNLVRKVPVHDVIYGCVTRRSVNVNGCATVAQVYRQLPASSLRSKCHWTAYLRTFVDWGLARFVLWSRAWISFSEMGVIIVSRIWNSRETGRPLMSAPAKVLMGWSPWWAPQRAGLQSGRG